MPTNRIIQTTVRRYGSICGIYAIVGPNEQAYVGASQHIWNRRANHFTALQSGRHSSSTLQRDWNRHGTDNFTFVILEHCTPEQLRAREMTWCRRLRTITHGYNHRYPHGGTGKWRNRISEETRQRMRQSQLQRWERRKRAS